MPWVKADAKKHCKAANTDHKAEIWAKVANETLEKTKDDGKALAAAATAVGNMKEDENIFRGRVQEAKTAQSGKVQVVVDGDTTTLKNVLLVGKSSRNGRDYSDEALRTALPMYEEAEVFVGHTRDGSNPNFDRSMGIAKNPSLAADGIRGDHSFPTKHRLAEDLVWRANHAPRGIGYSHDADTAWSYDAKGRKQIHAIERVYSVDLVTRPAGTKGMTEDEDETIPPEQREFAEHVFSALSDCRSIVLDGNATASEKRHRLLEEITVFHGEVLEGEIADEAAKDKPDRDLQHMHSTAMRMMDRTFWSDKHPNHEDKHKRLIELAGTYAKDLKSMPCCCNGKTQEETSDMEFKELTIETLTKERPDIIEKLQGKDEHTRLTEEIKTLRTATETKDAEIAKLQAVEAGRVKEAEIVAELTAAKFPTGDAKAFSSRFQEDLKRAKDKAERAEIIKDRMTLLHGRVQEQGLPSPLAQFNDAGQKTTASGINPAHDHLFGAKK